MKGHTASLVGPRDTLEINEMGTSRLAGPQWFPNNGNFTLEV